MCVQLAARAVASAESTGSAREIRKMRGQNGLQLGKENMDWEFPPQFDLGKAPACVPVG